MEQETLLLFLPAQSSCGQKIFKVCTSADFQTRGFFTFCVFDTSNVTKVTVQTLPAGTGAVLDPVLHCVCQLCRVAALIDENAPLCFPSVTDDSLITRQVHLW